MERFKTLSRVDPEFLSYLDGTFSSTHIARPMRTMNVATAREEVTFEIVPLKEVNRPAIFKVIWTAARPSSLILSLGPVLSSILLAWMLGHIIETAKVVPAVAGILFFHLGMNFLDDYFDHRRGIDRLNPRSGSRAIQNGWIRGRTMFHAGLGLLGLSILLGLPIILGKPVLFLAAALFALLIGWGFSSQTARLKYRGFGELTTFILSGPLLTVGFVWACIGYFSWEYFFLGCAFGFTTVLYYHLKNIENIMVDSQAETRTLATRLGFDSSKTLVVAFAAFSSLSILMFDWAMDTHGYYILVLVAHVFALVPIAHRLVKAPSPLSSELREIRARGLKAFWITAIAFWIVIVLKPILVGPFEI
jgi:1,4-dihydroxy-2-naphthoate polyprenyltransferase